MAVLTARRRGQVTDSMAMRFDAIKQRLPGRGPAKPGDQATVDSALTAKRDRLVEKFTAHQLDLGGVLYEMAIRDSVVMPVLLERAAAMQAVESDLKAAQAAVDTAQAALAAASGRTCAACSAVSTDGGKFCSSCGAQL